MTKLKYTISNTNASWTEHLYHTSVKVNEGYAETDDALAVEGLLYRGFSLYEEADLTEPEEPCTECGDTQIECRCDDTTTVEEDSDVISALVEADEVEVNSAAQDPDATEESDTTEANAVSTADILSTAPKRGGRQRAAAKK